MDAEFLFLWEHQQGMQNPFSFRDMRLPIRLKYFHPKGNPFSSLAYFQSFDPFRLNLT